VRKEGSGSPRKMNAYMLACLKRKLRKYSAMTAATAADLRKSIPEISKFSEKSV
jgi:hypothetical protein